MIYLVKVSSKIIFCIVGIEINAFVDLIGSD